MFFLWKYIKLLYELFRFKVRHNGKCIIPMSTRIKGGNSIELKGSIKLGSNCKLLCWNVYTSSLKKQKLEPKLEIGDNVSATRNLTIQCAGHIFIGNDVLFSSDIFIIDYNHSLDPRHINYLDGNLEVRSVRIEDGAWIGNNVVILPGSRIGKKSIIGAGSVVTGNIDDFCIAVGNPARVVKRYDFNCNKWVNINVNYNSN